MLGRIRQFGSSARYRVVSWARDYPPRSPNDYATHLPFLLGLARTMSIRRILEFGSGTYSTLAFLDRLAFPEVQSVDSIENDTDWYCRVAEAARGDRRLSLRHCPEPVEGVVHELPLRSYDMIFVDNSCSVDGRAATIAAVLRMDAALPPVVIHDFEIEQYRRAARLSPYRFECSAFIPATGVLWSDDRLNPENLQEIDRVIRKCRNVLDPADIRGWSAVLDDVPFPSRELPSLDLGPNNP